MALKSAQYALPGCDIPYSDSVIVAGSREVESIVRIRKTTYLEG